MQQRARTRWTRPAVATAIAATLLLAACGGDDDDDTESPAGSTPSSTGAASAETSAEPAEPAGDDILRIRLASDVVSLNPQDRQTGENSAVQVHLYDSLLTYDFATLELEPQLATDWSISDDATEFTFTLDPDATWHDGSPVTSEDVKFSIERALDPEVASPHAAAFSLVDSVEAPDATTVVITLSSPDVNFLHTMALQNQALILPKALVEAQGTDFFTAPVGSGPYVFESWTPGEGVTLSKNPDYYGPEPGFDGVEFRVIAEESVAATALRNGEIDVFWILTDPTVIDRLQSDDAVTVQETDSLLTCYVAINTSAPPFDDVRVRQAAAHAMDMESLVADYFEGTKSPGVTALTPMHREFTDDVVRYEYDPDLARELLAEAGYADGEVAFEFTSVALAPHDQYPVILVDQLNEAGFDATLNVMERSAYGEARAAGQVEFGIGCPPTGPSPDTTLRQVFHSDNFPPSWNTAYYDGVDDLLDAARAEIDDTARLDLYAQIQQKIAEDVPIIPVFTERFRQAHRDDIEGLMVAPTSIIDTRGAHRVAG